MDDDSYAMTEDDWLAGADPHQMYAASPTIAPDRMLQYLRVHRKADRTKQGRRKLRLFACACCRRIWPLLSAESRQAVEIAERYADGEASRKDLGYAWRISIRKYGRGPRTPDNIAGHVAEAGAMTAAALVPMVSYSVFASAPKQHHELWNELLQQALIIHDLFGNPFRTTADEVSSFAQQDSIRSLAERIYQSRDFDNLSELAILLRKAGCRDEEILQHFHQQQHFQGCWLLDALRGVPAWD